MFINCRHCNALVATDPATDLPPERCPRCAGVLRLPNGPAAPVHGAAMAGPATPQREAATAAPVQPAARHGEQNRQVVITDAEPATAGADTSAPVPPAGAGEGRAGPEAAAAPIAIPPSATGAPTRMAADEASAPEPGAASPPAVAAESGTTPARGDIPTEPSTAAGLPEDRKPGVVAAPPAPLFAGRGHAPPTRNLRPWRHPAAVAGLVVLLGLQIVLADRQRLAADPQWRPLVETVCRMLGCSVPAWRDPAAFVLLSRDVRPHPQRAGALLASASFRNDAPWPQPWPQLVLTLSDVDGRAVAARAFAPEEYLGAAPDSALVATGQSVDIALDIVEPSGETVSYAWDLR